MAIDPYTPCPGGTGKKIKFCCPDLVSELDKIHRMLEGEQRAACLDHIEKLEAKYPERACLLTIKSMLQMQLGQQEKAQATLANYMDKYPDNPVALAELATLKATQEGPLAAIEPLQQAIVSCDRQMPPQVYSAIGTVARTLVATGHPIAGRGHLMLQLSISGGEEREDIIDLLVQINASPNVPLIFKQDIPLAPAPDDALWKTGFNAALQFAYRGAWLKAAGKLSELAATAGDWPLIWRTIATLRGWLADEAGTVEALRKVAAQSVPLDDAVEAEALAQLLDPATYADKVDVLLVTYAASDADTLFGRFAAHAQADRIPLDLSRMGTETEPPPKGAYFLLDRAPPSTTEGLTHGAVPRIIGQAFLYGKQTDRDARLVLTTYRNEEQAVAQRLLAEVGGDALGPVQKEDVTGQVPAAALAMGANLRVPDDLPAHERTVLLAAERRGKLFNVWSDLRQSLLGGRSPREAAGDGAYRVKVLAAILLLETSDTGLESSDFNDLRRQLGLPTADLIEPTEGAGERMPLLRLARLDMEKLSDDDLIHAFQRAEHYHYLAAVYKLGLEMLRRPSLDQKVHKAEVYAAIAPLERDGQKAIEYVEEGRRLVEAAGQSSATFDLLELTMRLDRGEVADVERLIIHIRNEHLREPGVAQALMQVLVEAGIVRPDGAPAAARPEAPAIVVPGGAAASEPGKIWTPGSEPATSGKKSAIWTPE